MEEQRVYVRVDGRGLVVGQQELYVREHGVREDVVLT